jgi:hypothetical protein
MLPNSATYPITRVITKMPIPDSDYEVWKADEWNHLNNMYRLVTARLGQVITFDTFCKYIYSNSKKPIFDVSSRSRRNLY